MIANQYLEKLEDFEHAGKKAQDRGFVVHDQDGRSPASLSERQRGVFNLRLTHASTSLSDTQILHFACVCPDPRRKLV